MDMGMGLGGILDSFNYVVVIILMMTGLYVVFASRNMIKKLVGLSVFQTSVFLLYITVGNVAGGQPPIVDANHHIGEGDGEKGYGDTAYSATDTVQVAASDLDSVINGGETVLYSNPLPHVLILTAIVVGVATLAIGLALVVRVREVYGTIEEDRIRAADHRFNLEGTVDPS